MPVCFAKHWVGLSCVNGAIVVSVAPFLSMANAVCFVALFGFAFGQLSAKHWWSISLALSWPFASPHPVSGSGMYSIRRGSLLVWRLLTAEGSATRLHCCITSDNVRRSSSGLHLHWVMLTMRVVRWNFLIAPTGHLF